MTDKILINRSVLEQALRALESLVARHVLIGTPYDNRARALRAALVQEQDHSEQHLDMVPQVEQEPVAWASSDGYWTEHQYKQCRPDSARFTIPFYTHPQPPRQPLTEMEIVELRQLTPGTLDVQFVKFARVIEAAHGITGAEK